MNDPGLEEPISNDAKAVEENREKDEHAEAEEDEQEFLDPRYVHCPFPTRGKTWNSLKIEAWQQWISPLCVTEYEANMMKSLVVCIDSLSTCRWYIWTYGFGF